MISSGIPSLENTLLNFSSVSQLLNFDPISVKCNHDEPAAATIIQQINTNFLLTRAWSKPTVLLYFVVDMFDSLCSSLLSTPVYISGQYTALLARGLNFFMPRCPSCSSSNTIGLILPGICCCLLVEFVEYSVKLDEICFE